MTTVSKTAFPGVYFREGEGRKRVMPEGSKDKCFCIRYSLDGKWHFETIGWESDGITLEKAVATREARVEGHGATVRQHTLKIDTELGMKRVKAGPVGVYIRQSTHRMCQDGSPDICFDILYSSAGKMKFEKIGWISEGYTIDDAVVVRGRRIKALRHPDLCPEEALKLCGPTLDMVWDAYKERWLPNLKRNHTESSYRNYIQPLFGSRAVAGIQAYEVDAFKQALLKKVVQPSGKLLQPGTVKNVISTMRRIINKGEEWGIITLTKNPVSGIHVAGAERNRERFLSPEEAAKLLDGLQHISCNLYYIAKISLYTGLRLSEVIGLKRQDVELTSCTFQVDGKTGKRPGYFPEALRQEIEKILPKKGSDYIFTNAAGNPYNPKKISDKFSGAAADMGFNTGVTDSLHKVVFHTLRHTFCSWLAIKGVPLYTIGLLVGHSSVEMTQRYAKLSPDSKKQALKFIDATLQQK